ILGSASIDQHLLTGELRAAIRIDGILRGGLRDRQRVRDAIRCARAREHDRAGAVSHHRLDDVDEAGDVDAIIGERPRYRFPPVSQRCKMDYGIRSLARENTIEILGIEDIALEKRAPASEFGMSLRQVVE